MNRNTNKNKSKRKPNKKQLNNKVLKAKEILAKNKAALEAEKEIRKEAEKKSLPLRILRIVKNVFFGILIVVLAVVIISFLLVRVNGGTPDLFGYSIQRVVSGSMKPTLEVGDIILSKSVASPDEIEIDDIVTYKGGEEFENKNVTHRVVIPPIQNIDGDYVLTTKGDANERVDPEIKFSDVHSKMTARLQFLNKFYGFFLSPWGLIVFIAALLIIFFDELMTVVRVVTGNFNEEDEEDESIGEIMSRLKKEEVEAIVKQMEEEERKKNRRKKRNNASRKKQKRIAESKKGKVKDDSEK